MLPRASIYVFAALFVILTIAVGPSSARSDFPVPKSVPNTPITRAGEGAHHSHHASRGRNGHVFPFLTWLRDSTIELVFGRPSSKSQNKASTPYGGLQHNYGNEIVVRFNVTSAEEEGALSEAADRLFLDVWAFTTEYVDIRLHKDDVASLLSLLPTSLRSGYSTLIPDLAAAVWATYPSKPFDRNEFESIRLDPATIRAPRDGIDNIFFQDYQPMPVITRWMRLLEAMFPSIVNMTSIGKSYEGRDIPALRVGHFDELSTARRKTILVTGGLHAREWISTTTVNYLAWSFIAAYGKEPLITKLLNNFDIVFIPTLNPDGVEYTWQVDRLWRKSRQHTNLRFCRGLDLDHAFGYEWDGLKHQNDPCSESYGGDQPFQAVEAMQLARWARNETFNNVCFVGFLDLHSYSQQILFPFSYSCAVDPPNRENLEELAAGLSKAIRLSGGEGYGIASACEGAVAQDLGSSSMKPGPLPRIESGGGSAIDWFYHELKARYSYQIKLRDTGSYGFLLPRENIVPTGEEMFNAMKYFGDFLLGNNGIEKLGISNPLFDGPKKGEKPAWKTDEQEVDTSEADDDWAELRKRRRRR